MDADEEGMGEGRFKELFKMGRVVFWAMVGRVF